jgi:transposase, IS30 family
MKFAHLNHHQRYQIEARLAQGQSKVVIARALGVHHSTIYRECTRIGTDKDYCAEKAHRPALKRRAVSVANHPTKPPALWTLATECLRQDWSPEQIEGRLKLTEAPLQVSAQGVYDWLARPCRSEALRSHLRHHRAQLPCRQRRGGLSKNRPSIRKRPTDVLAREVAGHWEGDTVRGKTHHHCLVTLVERKSLYTRLSKPLPKRAESVAIAIRRALNGLPALSLTLDNGSEFAAYTQMGLPVFFADPGKPRQRARNENTNGLIRQYVPRKTRLMRLSDKKVRHIENRLNHRPRKSLGYRTPHEVLFNLPPTPFAIRT